MKTGKGLTLEQKHAAPRPGEKRARRGAGRPAPDHDDIVHTGHGDVVALGHGSCVPHGHGRCVPRGGAHRGRPTGFATGASPAGSASSRSWEHNHRTRGETKSGIDRGASACSARSPSNTGEATVAWAA